MRFNPKSLIIGAVFVFLILGYYFYLTNLSGRQVQDNDRLTPVERVLTENIDGEYPATPREVIKFFVEIQKCYYNEECSEEQLTGLAEQALKLFDEELKAQNPLDVYLLNLKGEIDTYRRDGKVLSNVSIPGSRNVYYTEVDGRECAYLTCSYYIREGANYGVSDITYLFRRDENRNWKMLAWWPGGFSPQEDGSASTGAGQETEGLFGIAPEGEPGTGNQTENGSGS